MRRRVRPPKDNTLQITNGAQVAISQMATRAALATVKPDISGERLVLELFPKDALDVCKAAYGICEPIKHYGGSYHDIGPPLVGRCVWVNWEKLGYFPLRTDFHEPANHPMFEDLFKVADSFDCARRAVEWLNKCATPAAARHYCPWLMSLGVDFPKLADVSDRRTGYLRETMPYSIAEDIRQSIPRIASGLMAPPYETPSNLSVRLLNPHLSMPLA